MKTDRASGALVVCEQSSAGHRLEYVRLIAELGAVTDRTTVLVTSPLVLDSPEYSRELSGTNVDVRALLEQGNTPRIQFVNTWRSLRVARRMSGVLVIPNVDEKLMSLLILRPLFPQVGIRGLLMRPASDGDRRAKSVVKRLLVGLLRKLSCKLLPITSPLVVDPDSPDSLPDPSGLIGSNPAQDLDDDLGRSVRDWKAMSTNRPVVAVIGVLDDRKSILELIKAVDATEKFRLIVAGAPASIESRSMIESAAQSVAREDLFVLTRSLEASEFELLLRLADVLALAYTNELGSSGLLVHAVRVGRPILGFRNRAVAQAVQTSGNGALLDSLQPEHIAQRVLEARVSATATAGVDESLVARSLSRWRDFLGLR